MITIHHLGISQSERVVWLCEELGLEYKLVKHTRDPVLSPESLKSVPGNETGKSPFIEDSDAGITLSESAAIVDYILARYGNNRLLIEPSDKNFPDYIYWFHYANGTCFPSFLTEMFLDAAGTTSDVPIRQFSTQRIEAGLRHMDDRLKSNKWLAGDEFTAADVMSVYTPTTQRYFGPQISLAPYQNLLRWLKDCSERPAYQRAMQKGDPEMKLLLGAEAPAKGMMEMGGVTSGHWKK